MKKKILTPKNLGKWLTFDDILLLPDRSNVLPKEVFTSTRLTKNITLSIPFLSAAMDTVTESRMAIAMAEQGGLGIIHKNLSVEEQAAEVSRVKRYESGRITNPITLSAKTTAAEANALFRKHGIEKLPLVDKNRKIVGLITYRDMAKNKEFPNATRDGQGRLRVGAAVGAGKDALLRARALVAAEADVLCIDTAHGHSERVIDTLKKIKKEFPRINVIAGNVGTKEGARALCQAGADAVKVGIGPGSICTTREITGVGAPQLSAVLAAYEVCSPLGIPVIADGGIKYSGDAVKALVFGADAVMAGSPFAGTDESPGDTIISNDQKFKKYRGMGSVEAMKRGSRDRYGQDDQYDTSKLVPEGVSAHVAYKGPLAQVIHQYVGGLRAGMGYLGAKDISSMRGASFCVITSAGLKESHTHDIFMPGPTPNYHRE